MAADGCPRSSHKRRPSRRGLGDDDDDDAPGRRDAGGSTPAGAVWFFCAPAGVQAAGAEEASGRHFLDACSLCKLPLRRSQDIYMCRGNLPFCSEECREEWMEVEDEPREIRSQHRSTISSRASAAAGSSSRKEQQGQQAASRVVFHGASAAVAAS